MHNDDAVFIPEGRASIASDSGCMQMENALSGELGQKTNYVR